MKAIPVLTALLLLFSACEFERSELYDEAEIAAGLQDALFNLHAVSVGYDAVNLEWNVVPDAVSYRYFRALSDDFTSTSPIEVPGTVYNDTGLTPNTKYYFMVCAQYSDGGEDCSKVLSLRTNSLPVPQNLRVTATTETSVSLAWDAVSGVTCTYVMYRNGVALGTSGTASFTDSAGLTVGMTYTYYVKCDVSPFGQGGQSNEVSTVIPISAPSGLTITSNTSTTVNLAWNAVAGAVRYQLYRDGIMIGDLTTNHFSDWNRNANATYNYSVSAVDSGNRESSKSAAIDITMPADNFIGLGYSMISIQSFSTEPIYGSDLSNQLPVGTIVFFHTRNGLYGKFEVQQFDYTISNDLILRIVTYDGGGSEMFDNYTTVRGTFFCDLDNGNESLDEGAAEFQWLMATPTVRYIAPLPIGSPTAGFYIYYTP